MSVTAVPLQPTPRRIPVMLWVGILAAIAIAVGLAFAAPSNPVSGFLATTAQEDGVVQTAAGLQHKVLEPGNDARTAGRRLGKQCVGACSAWWASMKQKN